MGIAGLRQGEVVLDLGSGAGFDAFLAAQQVGPSGFVIGVDMTPEMIKKARRNALKAEVKNIQFRLGEIEHLPIEDHSIDVVISNCVINLSPEKEAVFREAYRVLKPGGRFAISDIVATAELPNEVKNDPTLICGCMGGAVTIDRLKALIERAGFVDVHITPKDASKELIHNWSPGLRLDQFLISANIEGRKPA
jgi:ubiquinone/menaquinone biosynthesis C-methylase UbiE